MKNLPKLTWFLTAMVLFLIGNLVFTACKKDDRDASVPDQHSTAKIPIDETIFVEKDYLVFKDEEHFQKTILKTRGLTNTALMAWTDRYEPRGFTPFGAHVIRAKRECNRIIDEGTEAQLKDFQQNWASKVIIVEESIIKPILDLPYIKALVNEKGLVKIGNELVKYLDDRKIYMANGTEDRIMKALDLPVYHQSADIRVMPIFRWKSGDDTNIASQGVKERCSNKTNGDNRGSERVDGTGAFANGDTQTRILTTGDIEFVTFVYIGANMSSYIRARSFWGALMWKSHETNCSISGNAQYSITYGGSYSGSFSATCNNCEDLDSYGHNLPTIVSTVQEGSSVPIFSASGGGTFCTSAICCNN